MGFWKWLYLRAENEPIDDEVLRYFGIARISDREYSQAVVSLPCGTGHRLEVSILPAFTSIDLGLRDLNTDVVAEMGWWDDARWHPHALRWDELVKLHNYWSKFDDLDVHPSAAFLLLALFVGHGIDEQPRYSDRKVLIRKHYDRLQSLPDAEIEQVSEATLILPSEEDYKWTIDDELGWVFGGEYPCYSIRNRDHASGTEGYFPFNEWARIVEQM